MTSTNRKEECLKLMNELKSLPIEVLQNVNFEIQKTMKQFPPAKNINKFPYGLIIENIIARFINTVIPATQLDGEHTVGSEYKHDVKVLDAKYSIKASANIGSAITLVNKRHASDHDVTDINLITMFVKDGIITIIPLSEIDPSLIKNKDACIDLSGSFYNRYIKNTDYELKLPPLTEKQITHVSSLKEVFYSNYLYETFVRTP
jgi:hypothetical protein